MTVEVIHFDREGQLAIPYLWVSGVSDVEFEETLLDEEPIVGVDQLDTTPRGSFYKVCWEVDSPLISCLAHHEGVIMQAQGTAGGWTLKIWFEERAKASSFQHCCTRSGVPIDIRQLSSVADAMASKPVPLSARQQEAIVLAYRRGYFEEPRTVSQRELADELDISSSALGRRLRRGFRNLVETSIEL